MDVQESEIQVSKDCQGPIEESIKIDSSNPDFNDNENPATNELSDIPMQNEDNISKRLIVNGKAVDLYESESKEPNLEDKGVVVPLQDGTVEQEIVTTFNEVSCGVDSTSNSQSLHDSCESKIEESSISSSNSVLDESLPSFIGEIDESVSLPPAEPLILEKENIPQENEIEEVIVMENITDDESTSKDFPNSNAAPENILENETKNETGVENSIQNVSVVEIHKENEISQVDEKSDSVESIEGTPQSKIDTINTSEIELSETSQTEIIPVSESNIQYTILPPGENSVYQEDGTLIVEYPLNTTAVEENSISNITEYVANQKDDETAAKHEILVKTTAVKEERNVTNMETDENEDNASEIDKIAENVTATDVQINTDKVPKQRGRKATEGIPPHIIGSSIDNPAQDINGKGLKPRLGVKIPYRKLASQIVSTTDLENHIIERARLKEETRSESEKQTMFAKKLTHRLARTIMTKKESSSKNETNAEPKKSEEGSIQVIENILASTTSSVPDLDSTNPIEIEQIVNEENVNIPGNVQEVTVSASGTIQNAEIIFSESMTIASNIENNSDLIAILEGDGDEASPLISVPNVVEIVDISENTSEIKAIEKEISETEQKNPESKIPQVKEKKFFKSRESRLSDVLKEKATDITAKVKVVGTVIKVKESVKKNEDPLKDNIFDIETTSVMKTSNKSAETRKPAGDNEKSSSAKGKSSGTVVEVEPQLKPAMVLKTYTRKRKSNDVATPEPAKKALIVPSPSSQPDPKIDCVTPTPPDVYITKSSRVIKRKVIWDPDEAMPSVRSQSKILNKIETSAKTSTPSKLPVTQKGTPAKVPDKKVQEKEKQTVEKKVTKTIQDDKEKKAISERLPIKKPDKVEVPKKTVAKMPEKPQPKILISSVKVFSAKSPKKNTKRLSEIDKLLMDEGAVNMLNEINSSDDQKRRVSGRIGTSTPTEKLQNTKELLNKSLETKSDSSQAPGVVAASPKSLRKREGAPSLKKEMKEPATYSRKMSKDSIKSSTHSPPPSPAAFTLCESSRIIRRHSSSSFSSTDGLPQDKTGDVNPEKDKERQIRNKNLPVEKCDEPTDTVCSERDQEGKSKDKKKRPATTSDELPKKKVKQDDTVVANGEPLKPTEIFIKGEPGIVKGPLKTDPSKAFTVIKMNKHYMINLTYFGGENYLNLQLMRDLVVTLKELERTRNCSVVSINSQGSSFCLGINYKELVESDATLRNKKIAEYSHAVRDLLKCLLNFSKVIVAGIKGDCVGLGVTMLPLFDMIVATDTANFCTPYAKVGCPPEAGFLLSIPFQSNHGLAAELLYTSHRMNADEAQRRGLVTKLFWPENFDSEFRNLLSHISNLSKPSLMVTKRQLRQANQSIADTEIIRNSKLLKNYWASDECQKDFVNYNAITFDIDHQ